MLIRVHAAGRPAEVCEADELRRFSVVADHSASDEDVAASLGPLGRLDAGTHAWISIESLRAASGRTGDATWCAGFDDMVGYAASKGWVDDTGRELRAHLERDSSS